MIRIVMLIILQVACFSSFGQNERNIWYFGKYAGLDFNIIPPSYLSDGFATTYEASCSISDKNGDMLIYVNGWDTAVIPYMYQLQVWNRDHHIMQNSSGIYGNTSMTQGILILPKPSDSTIYYLLSIRPFNWDLHYSIIDMNLDSGRGGLTQKNIFLSDSITEKLTTIKHANGRDWWIITHQWGTNIYIEYLLTPWGIMGPYTIGAGQTIGVTAGTPGQLVFSQDGNMLCMANHEGQLDLLSFDRCTGMITIIESLDTTLFTFGLQYYGCSFSPDNKVLYVSKWNQLYQFDLTVSNIKASKINLYSVNLVNEGIGQHLLGPDNKIYIAHEYYAGPSDSSKKYLSVINYPDSLGIACGFLPYSFWLGNKEANAGLPNLPNYNSGPVYGSVCDSLSAGINDDVKNGSVSVYPNPVSTTATLTYKNPQQRGVTLTVYDVLGSAAMQKQSSGNSFIINAATLKSGMYFYTLTLNNVQYNGKFVVR